jgi:hypothetical protein
MPPYAYYQPGNLYGSPVDYSTAPIVSGPGGYLATNPEAAYARWSAPWASGTDPFSNYVRSQQSQVYNTGYKAAAGTNPNLSFQDYLNQLGPGLLRQRFVHQAPQQRGIANQNYGGGRVRWSLQ